MSSIRHNVITYVTQPYLSVFFVVDISLEDEATALPGLTAFGWSMIRRYFLIRGIGAELRFLGLLIVHARQTRLSQGPLYPPPCLYFT